MGGERVGTGVKGRGGDAVDGVPVQVVRRKDISEEAYAGLAVGRITRRKTEAWNIRQRSFRISTRVFK